MKDKLGIEIKIGSLVKLLDVQPHWFEYESEQEAKKLHESCKKPLTVSDIYDGKVTLDLPSTKAHDGDMVGNCITTTPDKVEVV